MHAYETHVYAAFRGPLVRIVAPGGGVPQDPYILESFDSRYRTNLVQRWQDGQFTIIPEVEVYDRSSAWDFFRKLDDPEFIDYILHNRKRDWSYERH